MPRRSSTPRRSTQRRSTNEEERTTLTKEQLIQRIDDASSATELDHLWEHCRLLGYSADGLMGQRLTARRETLKRRGSPSGGSRG